MNSPDFKGQFLLELIALGLFFVAYLILRHLIFRRPITYKEYEKWFFVGSAVLLIVFIFFILGDKQMSLPVAVGFIIDAISNTLFSVAADTTAANLFLGVNPFYRQFTNSIALTTQAQNLPNMQGSGWVRHLREATSNDCSWRLEA